MVVDLGKNRLTMADTSTGLSEVVSGTDVVVTEVVVANRVVVVARGLKVVEADVVTEADRSTWLPSTSTVSVLPLPESANGPKPAAVMATTSAQAPASHQNQRPSLTIDQESTGG